MIIVLFCLTKFQDTWECQLLKFYGSFIFFFTNDFHKENNLLRRYIIIHGLININISADGHPITFV